MLRTRLCGIFTVVPRSATRTMAYRFYEPRLVQHCKQSAYLLHGSLILVRVKYKRGHRASTTDTASQFLYGRDGITIFMRVSIILYRHR